MQVFVVGSQRGAGASQSASDAQRVVAHWFFTQLNPDPQSASTTHATHLRVAVLHASSGAVQSDFAAHVDRSPQLLSLRHRSPPSHCAFSRQATHE
jgi:hypothetical protein